LAISDPTPSNLPESCRDDGPSQYNNIILKLVERSYRRCQSLSSRRIPSSRRRRHDGPRTAKLRQLQSANRRLRRRRAAAVGPRARVGGGTEVVGLARRRKAGVPVRFANAKCPDKPFAGRLGCPGQQQVEHGPLPAKYKKYKHATERVDRVRSVPVVSGRFHRPRDHFENESHAHQTEQL